MAPVNSSSKVRLAGSIAKAALAGIRKSTQRKKGASSSLVKVAEAGVKFMVAKGIKKVMEAGSVRNLAERGVARVQRDGIKKVVEDVKKLAMAGLLEVIPREPIALSHRRGSETEGNRPRLDLRSPSPTSDDEFHSILF